MTTLKLRPQTRDLIRTAAQEKGLTVDAFLAELMAEEAWRSKMGEAKAAMAGPHAEYLDETAQWDLA